MPLKRAKSFLVISLLSLLPIVISAVLGQLPPREALKVVEMSGEKFLEGKWEGIYYCEILEPRRTEVSAQLLADLIYERDEIPGFLATPNPFNGIHTNLVILNSWARIERAFRSLEKTAEGDPLHVIDVAVWVMPSKEEAKRRVQETIGRAAMLHEPRELPSGLPLGEEFWYWESPINKICFLVGRVAAWVSWHSKRGKADPFVTEALAWGIEYRVRQHSKMLGMVQRPLTVLISNQTVAQGKAISLGGCSLRDWASEPPCK